MSKKIFGTTALLSMFLFGAYGVFAYTTEDGYTNDRNTDLIKGDIDGTVTSTCLDLKSEALRYRSNDATTGGEVSELQDFLIAGGLLKTQATGYFGLSTLAAVKAYQKSVGLSSTGYVGPLTRAKIKATSCTMGQTTEPVVQTDSGVIKMKPGIVACTMEARLCPDGTMMKRDPNTCKWIDSSCASGQNRDQLKSVSGAPATAAQKVVSVEDQQREYVCQKQKTVCDTGTSNYNGYACKETTALCERLRGIAPGVLPTTPAQTNTATTARIFNVSCLYAAPPVGCTYVPGPNYEAGSDCGMVLYCPNGVGSTTTTRGGGSSMCVAGAERCGDVIIATSTRIIDPIIYQKTPISPPAVACTMVMRLCPNGSAMPRDSNCGWHPELCTGGDAGGFQSGTGLQAF